jgi:azurin
VIAEAALYRAGVVTSTQQASESPVTVAAAAALAGRGKVPEILFPVVADLLAEGHPPSHHAMAIKALPLFPGKDAQALKLLAETAERYAEKGNLKVSFAALEAMKRIPKAIWPATYENKIVNVIRINATADLRFDPAMITVKAGSAVRLTFFNPDSMYHNLAIIEKGALDDIGLQADQMAGDPDGLKKNYLPDDKRILHATPQITLGPGLARSHVLVFYAPTEPGDYPYICTFPGHWRAMKGVMKVVE